NRSLCVFTIKTLGGQYCITLSETLTAEAGLCVVIPCSFTTGFGFTPKHIVWYKCEAYSRCDYDHEIIFHSKNNIHVQYGFEGRVSLLEPDIRQNNCSIIINDLKESDSGLYRIRVNGERKWRGDGFASIQRTTIPTLTEGQQATLTCVAPGLCSGSVPEITWTWSGAGGTESYITGSSTSFRTKTLTAGSTLKILPSKKTTVMCPTDIRTPQIIGNTIIKEGDEGDVLNLTCSVESFPPALIMWRDLSSKTNSKDTGAYTDLQNDTEDSGQYTCTATHLDTTVTSSVSFIFTLKIIPHLDVSECVLQAEVLTCVCVSEGFPLPTIKWPLLGNHKEYAIKTTVSNHTVNSTVSLKVKNYGNSTVECVSNNEKGEAKKNLMIRSVSDTHIYDGQETQDNQSNPQEEVEDESVAAEKDVPEISGAPQEVEYADIDFSLLKRNSKSERKQESTKTEYAEIKKAIKDKREEMMTEMDLKQSELEKEKEEDEPVYSTVNDVIDKI
uniref:B-cell receptor CD22 n=1 Tax=Maylandia zebra TaxID=106582 RepID=A0A3P9BNV0_9CICH